MHIPTEAGNIERILDRAGISLGAVLSDARIDRSTWSRWKSEKTSPRIRNWQAVIDAARLRLSAPCIPSADDTEVRAAESSPHPTHDTDRLPAAAPNSDEGAGA